MSVIRIDLDKCIGCGNCVDICPMDVFCFDHNAHKSVIVFPEACQSCGQCYFNCKGRSLGISNETFGYPITSVRSLTPAPLNHVVVTQPGMIGEITGGKMP